MVELRMYVYFPLEKYYSSSEDDFLSENSNGSCVIGTVIVVCVTFNDNDGIWYSIRFNLIDTVDCFTHANA
jgi:hypothetical protein